MGRRGPLVGVVFVLAISACANAGGPVAVQDPVSPSASASPSASVSASPATAIPGAAMLQPEDLRGVVPERPAADVVPYLRPPRPCGKGGSSDRARLAAAAISVVYPLPALDDEPEHPTVLLELVMRFGGEGPAQYLAELRDELTRCAKGADGTRWQVISDDGTSLLFAVTKPQELPDGGTAPHTVPVFVARADSGVVVLADLGWESGGGDEKVVRQLAPRAVERARQAL
jgi:hypothetical protein